LGKGERRVACARWQVDDQVIQLAPFHVAEKLADCRVEHRAAPDQWLPWLDQEAHRHHLHAVGLGRDKFVPARVGHMRDAHHRGHIGTVDIGVQQAYARAAGRERHSNVDRHGTLSNAALARGNRNRIADRHINQPAHASIVGNIRFELEAHRFHARNGQHGLAGFPFDLPTQGAGRGGEHNGKADLRIFDRQVADHAK